MYIFKRLLSRHVIPLSFSLMSERKLEIRQSTEHLIQSLYNAMDTQYLEQVNQLTGPKREKILALLT